MNKTAVEWLYSQQIEYPLGDWDYFLKQAKEMEKQQAERMYSEEEVEKIVRDAYTFGEKEFKHFGAFEDWFKQFKKK